MAYGLSNGHGHVTDDVTWPPKVLWGGTVGYLATAWLLVIIFTPHSGQKWTAHIIVPKLLHRLLCLSNRLRATSLVLLYWSPLQTHDHTDRYQVIQLASFSPHRQKGQLKWRTTGIVEYPYGNDRCVTAVVFMHLLLHIFSIYYLHNSCHVI